MLSYRAESRADPEVAWALVARPDRWRRWAPHVRGATSLGEPEVVAGRRGAVRVFPFIPIPARITAKRAGRSWSWRVGPATLVHRVEPAPGGCVVAVDVRARAPVERLLEVSYGPVISLLVRNLARVAERDQGASAG